MVVSIVLTGVLIAAQTRVLKPDRLGGRVRRPGPLRRRPGLQRRRAGRHRRGGLAGARTGSTPPPALVVAALLLWGAIGVFREAADQLMDHELPEDDRAAIVAPGHRRTRASPTCTSCAPARPGPYVHMQMHVDLDPEPDAGGGPRRRGRGREAGAGGLPRRRHHHPRRSARPGRAARRRLRRDRRPDADAVNARLKGRGALRDARNRRLTRRRT